MRSILCILFNICLLKSPKIFLFLTWYSQTQFCNFYQCALVASAATGRDSSKHSKSDEVISALETVNKTRALYSISEKSGIIIEFYNLNSRFGLNLSAKDFYYHKGVDDSMISWWQKEPVREATLKHAKENLSNYLVRFKGTGLKVLFPGLEIKIICQAKKRWEINLFVSTCLIKVTIMILVK